jgi:drug/metabolite transporter (DMT)-like permease
MDLSSPAENERHMPEEARQEWRRRHRGHFLIPAGVLIGLGVGLLLNQPGPGVLIGLGLGFVGSAFLSSTGPSQDTPAPPPMYGPRWIPVIIGAFIILLGLWTAWGPPLPWTYFIAFVFILIGIGFIARGLGRMR